MLIELAGGKGYMKVSSDGVYLNKAWMEEVEGAGDMKWGPRPVRQGSGQRNRRKLLPFPFSSQDLSAFILCPAAEASALLDLFHDNWELNPGELRRAFKKTPDNEYINAMREASAHLVRAYEAVGPKNTAHEELAQKLDEQYKAVRLAARERLGIVSLSGHGLSVEEYNIRINKANEEAQELKSQLDIAKHDVNLERSRWLNAMVEQIYEQELVGKHDTQLHDSEQEAAPAAEEKKQGPTPLKSRDIAFVFSGLRWTEKEWMKPLGDKPKWLQACVAIPAQRGVSQTHWNPVLIGAALLRVGYVKANQVRGRFQSKPQLKPWLDEWKTYEADHLDND